MLHFECDYLAGACEPVMNKLIETNMEKLSGYGNDDYCKSAKEKIMKACELDEGVVHLLIGGTQTNATTLCALLHGYEGVIAAESGHIAVHESGAIEATGHKVLTLPQVDGKINAGQVKEYLEDFYSDATWEHMVVPGAVYITHPTEFGTLYKADEIKALHTVCKEYNIPLYVDGARLCYALSGEGTDVTLPFLAKNCDVFYIGGTKCGAMFGEAVVSQHKNILPHFFTTIKQHGALMAKGRLLGVQFDALFTDDLYFNLGKEAVANAIKLKDGFRAKGYTMFADSPTNQQFVVMDNDKIEKLKEKVGFEMWQKYDDTSSVIRFVTSWSTGKTEVDELLALV